MSPDGHREQAADAAVFVCTFPMGEGLVYDWHTHADHQLAWAAAGVLMVRTRDATWVLPPTRALWIPAGLPHETLSSGPATMRSLYLRPGQCPVSWPDPTPVAASELLVELVGHLERATLTAAARHRAEVVLADLLQPVPLTTIGLRLPGDERAREVAAGLIDTPADQRGLAQWGQQVGASERTLARAFVAGTGMTFGRWRTLARLQAALPRLAAGEPVSRVAGRVGYETPSAFVAAFRRETGLTPGAYGRGQPGTCGRD